jgi:hypothetical protein
MAPALAAPITFDFDGMAYRSSSSPGANADVQTYMRGIWTGAGQAGNINVSGAGELSNNQYTGDGHVVGQSVCTLYWANGTCRTWTIIPATLGTTDGAVQPSPPLESPLPSATNPDNYIVNSGADRIIITFPSLVYSISFDFEIFPDGTCTSLPCGNHVPDFELLYGNTLATLSGPLPVFGTAPASPGYTHSPASGSAHTELAPQFIGVSGTINIPGGARIFEFIDWPERIGIDNLVVNTSCNPCQQVPEPPMLPTVILGLGLLLLVARRARVVR